MSDTTHRTLAAIDLGSNSFHVTLADLFSDGLRWQETLSEKVQLAAGLSDQLHLSEEAQARGLSCLARFAERIAKVDRSDLKVVGTNTLRMARNANDFVHRAETLLNCRIDIISGDEEARMINLGVSHALADNRQRRLVIDIGGGSTELIVGIDHRALHTTSLFMGCVGFTQRFFPSGKLTPAAYEAAYQQACELLRPVKSTFINSGWECVYGTSGTVKAVAKACANDEGRISLEAIQRLKEVLWQAGHSDNLSFAGVAPSRRHIFPAGLAILEAVMRTLNVSQLHFVIGALREGVLHQLADAPSGGHPADDSLAVLAHRCMLDQRQAKRVKRTATLLYYQVPAFATLTEDYLKRLQQAADVHEAGRVISHERHEQHGSYLLQHAALSGFSRHEQKQLALLVRAQRGILPKGLLHHRDANWLDMALLLRLAICFHHAHQDEDFACVTLVRKDWRHWRLHLPANWKHQRPLLGADLRQECIWLQQGGLHLALRFDLSNTQANHTTPSASSH